jgi:hypothetical protein
MLCPNCGREIGSTTECPFCHATVTTAAGSIPTWQPFNSPVAQASPTAPPQPGLTNNDVVVKLLQKIERHTSTAAGVLVTLLVFYCIAILYMLTVILRIR